MSAVVRTLIAALLLGNPAAYAQQATSAPGQAASPAASVAATVPLTDIAEQSQTTSARLDAMTADSPADRNIVATGQSIPDWSAQVKQWLYDTTKALKEPLSLDTLADLDAGGRKLQGELDRGAAGLNERAKALDDDTSQLNDDLKLWTATVAATQTAPADTLALAQGVLGASNKAAALIKDRRTNVLEVQSQLSKLGGNLRGGLEAVRQANTAALQNLFVRDSPPLGWGQMATAAAPAENKSDSPASQAAAARAYASAHLDLLALHGAIILGLLGLLLWLRRGLHSWTEEEPRLKRAAPIFEVPFATAVALSFLLKGPIYTEAPPFFKAALGAVWLVPLVIILRRLLDARLRPAVYSLLLFYFAGEVRMVLAGFPRLDRWILTGELIAAIGVLGWVNITSVRLAASGAEAVLSRLPRFLARVAILLLVAALAADVLGYVRLSTTLATGVWRSGYAALFLYALLQVLQGLLLIALRVPPLRGSHIARQHQAEVHQHVSGLLRVVASLVWAWWALYFFQIHNPVTAWAAHALKFQLAPGLPKLTVEHVLGFVAAIWLSLLLARVIRFFLEEEVFERVHLAPGLPYAIATILNYLVLFVGFLIALGVLGVDLTQVTILAGAFSVGLGFGLQNIINNFVSGVILLFERPVKVGDIIQIGDAIGEVCRIGIRASVISTRDGSSVIVPNGSLISNQFTNWTYSDRNRSIEITLSLVSGTDPNHVLELLKTAAAAHASTKDQPAPEAFITTLSATGMGVVVRAWISHYEDWVQTRSALTVALVEALARENIKLT